MGSTNKGRIRFKSCTVSWKTSPGRFPTRRSTSRCRNGWGIGLLFESMLDTVLVARDRFLKPGGAVLPDIATIHIAGFDRAATDFPFWDDVYGFKMPEISKQLRAARSRRRW